MQPAEDNHRVNDVSLCLSAEGFFMGTEKGIRLENPE